MAIAPATMFAKIKPDVKVVGLFLVMFIAALFIAAGSMGLLMSTGIVDPR